LEVGEFCFEFSCKVCEFRDSFLKKLFCKGVEAKRITKEAVAQSNFYRFIPWVSGEEIDSMLNVEGGSIDYRERGVCRENVW
jgi:hypothetical protein